MDRSYRERNVSVVRLGDVVTVAFDAPESRNALTAAMLDAAAGAVEGAGADDRVRAIVVTGVGSTFSAGANLKVLDAGDSRERAFKRLFEAIESAPKPVIAQVNGHAVGGAVGVVAACDLSVMATDATLFFPEARLGRVAAIAAVPVLRRISLALASELFLLGRVLSAEDAAAFGLVNRAAHRSTLDSHVDQLVAEVRTGEREAVGQSKLMCHALPRLSRDAAYEWAASAGKTTGRPRPPFE